MEIIDDDRQHSLIVFDRGLTRFPESQISAQTRTVNVERNAIGALPVLRGE